MRLLHFVRNDTPFNISLLKLGTIMIGVFLKLVLKG